MENLTSFHTFNATYHLKIEQEIFGEVDGSLFDNEILTQLPLDMRFNEGNLLVIMLYLVLMLLSATGNSFVFCSIMRSRQKKGKLGRVNMLLLNLALADLVVTFVMMPLEIAWNITVSWHAGDITCRFLSFFRVFGLYLSGFVLICICLDRYLVVMKPFTVCNVEARNRKMLICAWIASIVCSLPQSFIFHVERHPYYNWYKQCVTFDSFPSPNHELAYSLFGFIFMYAVPMATILYCYTCILFKIHSVANQMQNEAERRFSATFIQRAKTKTLKMTIITALAYCICWTPYNVISLWYWFDKSSAMNLDPRVQKALFVFACSNSCVNPLIYVWYHFWGRPKDLENVPQHQKVGVPFISGNHQNVVQFRRRQESARRYS